MASLSDRIYHCFTFICPPSFRFLFPLHLISHLFIILFCFPFLDPFSPLLSVFTSLFFNSLIVLLPFQFSISHIGFLNCAFDYFLPFAFPSLQPYSSHFLCAVDNFHLCQLLFLLSRICFFICIFPFIKYLFFLTSLCISFRQNKILTLLRMGTGFSVIAA